MKKTLCIVVALFIFALTGCSSTPRNEYTDNYYKFNRKGITEVTGTSQMSDPIKNAAIPMENVEGLLNKIEELCLQPTDAESDVKGWEYLFVVKYDDGHITQISLSDKLVKIDGVFYKTTLYHSNNFLEFFDQSAG